jgi:Cro/C1-type HTH DNA-binding domain
MGAQENVRRVVRVLMADQQVTSDRLAAALKISAESFRSKKTGRRPWTLDETCALAAYFGIPLSDLIAPPEWDLLTKSQGQGHKGLFLARRIDPRPVTVSHAPKVLVSA